MSFPSKSDIVYGANSKPLSFAISQSPMITELRGNQKVPQFLFFFVTVQYSKNIMYCKCGSVSFKHHILILDKDSHKLGFTSHMPIHVIVL